MSMLISLGNAVTVIPVELFFWGFVITYVAHILEEAVLPEIFVEKVKRLYWPQYSRTWFFGFNASLLSLNIAAVVTFESRGGSWIIFPLSLACERVFNGFYHLAETLHTRSFSSGLLTSVVTWILAYLMARYCVAKGEIPLWQCGISASIGLLLLSLMMMALRTGKYLTAEKPSSN
jgi:hypothetical protein